MKQQGQGFKRVRKCIFNKCTTLATVYDGGFLQNKWYQVAITVRRHEFEIRMVEEKQGNTKLMDINEMEVVLTAQDADIALGSVGFGANGNSEVYFDQFSVKPVECIKPPILPDVNYIPPQASRFKEAYFGQLDSRWKTIDPENAKVGPSNWKFVKDKADRDEVLYQGSQIIGTGTNKVGTMALLNFEKTYKEGIFTYEFFAGNEGIIGGIFRYENSRNYYIFEIGSGAFKGANLRKVSGGKFTSLAKDEDKSYEKTNTWYGVKIVVTGDDIKVYMGPAGGTPEPVFGEDAISDEKGPRKGTVGVSTYGTKAAFDKILMKPPQKKKTTASEYTGLFPGDNSNNNGGGDDGFDDEGMEAAQEEEAQVFDNEKTTTFNWDQCVDLDTPEERQKYCNELFEDDDEAITYCMDNFCDNCCSKKVDWMHKVQRFTCMKECKAAEKSSKKDVSWKKCIETSTPAISIYQYCESETDDSDFQDDCKRDFCSLCCVMSDKVFSTSFDDDSITSCQKECGTTFA